MSVEPSVRSSLRPIGMKFHQVLGANHGPFAFRSNLMRVKEKRYLIYAAFGGNLITMKPLEFGGSAKNRNL